MGDLERETGRLRIGIGDLEREIGLRDLDLEREREIDRLREYPRLRLLTGEGERLKEERLTGTRFRFLFILLGI